MQHPMTADRWLNFPKKAAEWFKDVEAGKAVNKVDPSIPVKPYRPAPADK